MSRVELLEPVLQDGIKNTNFFNGRLLSAEDLRTEQRAGRAQRGQIAEAVGPGVVRGLRVAGAVVASPPGSSASAVVTVSAGLAFNSSGQALELPSDTEVALVRDTDSAAAEAGLFATCQPPQTTTIVAGVGVYLLTLSPASGFSGRAPASGLGGEPLSSPGCGSRFAVEGIRFRLLDLNVSNNTGISAATQAEILPLLGTSDEAAASRLRNLLAHACLGTDDEARFLADPYGQADGGQGAAGYGAIDGLRGPAGLTACDVPLALIYWTTNGIEFVDNWSARRRVARGPSHGLWSPLADERRAAEGEAAFQQFQEHVEGLLSSAANPLLVRAVDYFRQLPPAGVIPLALAPDDDGFDFLTFFGGLTYREPVFLEGARLSTVLRDSWAYPAVDLHNPVDVESKQMFWLYNVRENTQRREVAPAAQSYLVFATGQMPFAGDPRVDVARWDYSHYV